MKHFHVSEDIIPIAEFKVQAAQVLKKLQATNRAVIITQHGKPAAVMMSPDEFDRLVYTQQFLAAVSQGLQESQLGKVISNEAVRRSLDTEFGPLGDE